MYQIERSLFTTLAVSVLLLGGHSPTIGQNQDARVLELGKPLERELEGEQAHNYLIKLATNDFLHVIVEQRGVDVVVTVYLPDGKKLKEVDSPNGEAGPEPVLMIAETLGVYRLEVRSLEQGARGKYAVKIAALHVATNQDKKKIKIHEARIEAQAINDQANILHNEGRYNEAIPLVTRALTIQEILGQWDL
jgi:hypothetical protein